MKRSAWSRIFVGLLALGGLVAAWSALQEWRDATVVVEWSTASELDTVGFNLYRSEQPVGGYAKINTTVIPSSGDALSGGDYRYEDRDVQAGRTYYYALADVTPSGEGERYGPITVKAKGHIGVPAAAALVLLGGAFLLWGWSAPPPRPSPPGTSSSGL